MKLDPTQTAAENARRVLPKMARKYIQAGRQAMKAKRGPDELHDFRLKTKRFRYTLELFRPLYGSQMDQYLKSLKSLQGALGKVSDNQAIQDLLGDDEQLRLQLVRESKKCVKELRQEWRVFDAPGRLKNWKAFLTGEHLAIPSRFPSRRAPSAIKKAAVRGAA
jgi:CHAD domain-containing protein